VVYSILDILVVANSLQANSTSEFINNRHRKGAWDNREISSVM